MTVEELRRAFQEGSGAPPEGECPAPETIWEAVEGELPPDRLRAVVEHTARCGACALEWRLAQELSPSKTAGESRPAAPSPRRLPAWTRVAALAAGLLLALALPLWHRGTDEPGWRGTPSGIEFNLLTTSLPRANPELRWQLPPEATYDLTVSTADGTPLVHDEMLRDPIYPLPAAKLADLPPGTRLDCVVKVSLPDGRRETRSFAVTLQ